jgi:uncharacterized protein YuzE
MKIDMDKDANAAYIYIKECIEEGEVAKTIEVNQDILLDFDKDNKLLGIEIKNAKENLSKELKKSLVFQQD